MESFYFEMLVAYSKNYGIGIKNQLPWKITNDLKRFKTLTEHHVVIMGKNTFVSLPEKNKPLSNRINIVLTRNPDQPCFELYKNTPDLYIVNVEHLQEILKPFEDRRLFVIGGQQIYDLFLPFVQIIHGTCVYKNFHNCDTYLDMGRIEKEFVEQHATPFMWSPEEECNYKYITFTKPITPS